MSIPLSLLDYFPRLTPRNPLTHSEALRALRWASACAREVRALAPTEWSPLLDRLEDTTTPLDALQEACAEKEARLRTLSDRTPAEAAYRFAVRALRDALRCAVLYHLDYREISLELMWCALDSVLALGHAAGGTHMNLDQAEAALPEFNVRVASPGA